MLKTDFFQQDGNTLSLKNISLNVEMDEYLQDLLEYGLGKYDVDFSDAKPEETFHLWAPYRKSQVQQLLLNNPEDIMLGTKIYDGIVYIYVTVIKDSSIKEALKYADGYIDPDTFQWETVANVSKNERIEEIYNGKGAEPWQACGKPQKNGQRSISIRKLTGMNANVPAADRIPDVI